MNIILPKITVGELIDTLSQYDRNSYVSFGGLDYVELSEPFNGKVEVIFLQTIERDDSGFCEIVYM